MPRSMKVMVLVIGSVTLFAGCDPGRTLDPGGAEDVGISAARVDGSQLPAPVNATAVAISPTGIDVHWEDNSTNESGFEVHRSTSGAAGNFTLFVSVAADVAVHPDRALESATQYCYRMRAVRLIGKKLSYSSFSSTVCATTQTATPPPPPPATPLNLLAVGAEYRIDLSWRDESSDESFFLLMRSEAGAAGPYSQIASKVPGAEAHADLHMPAGRLYCYYVQAVREDATSSGTVSSYSPNSNIACASPVSPPPPPAPPPAGYEVSAVPASSSSVGVRAVWTDASATPDGLRAYRASSAAGPWEAITLVPGSDYAYDFGRASEQQVCYRVVAYNAAGDSEPSNAACVTPPAGPTGLIATPIDAGTLELTWADNSGVESGYEVWAIDRWASDCYNAGYSEWEVRVAQLPPNATSWRTNRVAATCHNAASVYYVVAVRDGGRSDLAEVSAVDPSP